MVPLPSQVGVRRCLEVPALALPLAVEVAVVLALALVMIPSEGAAATVSYRGRAAAARRTHGQSKGHARGAHAAIAARKAVKPRKQSSSNEWRVAAIKGGLPNVQAQGALVLDENGHELYARNADIERPIASISKLAATLAVMDAGLELEGLSTITRADIEVARGGARSRLLEGMTLSNRDLLHAALMGSDNRAIPALGRAVKLSPSQLVAAMMAKVKELGLRKTRFHDPTGLSIENVSTPRETIMLLQAVMRHPVLGPITQRVQYDAHPIGRPPIVYFNTYRPAVRTNVQVLGGKTGYNDDARYCLVLAARVDGHTCFMSFLANEGKLTRFGDVARVADWMVSRKPKTAAPVLANATPVPIAPLFARAATATATATAPLATTVTTTTTTTVTKVKVNTIARLSPRTPTADGGHLSPATPSPVTLAPPTDLDPAASDGQLPPPRQETPAGADPASAAGTVPPAASNDSHVIGSPAPSPPSQDPRAEPAVPIETVAR